MLTQLQILDDKAMEAKMIVQIFTSMHDIIVSEMQRKLITFLYRIVTASRNPYEFEPATPYLNESNNDHITQFGDFIDSPIMASTPTNHDKSTRLEHAAALTSERPNSLHIPTPKLRPIPRCDSSPVISSPLMFTVRQCAPEIGRAHV